MTNILVVTHGEMAKGLLSSVEMIFGKNNNMDFVSLTPEMDAMELFEKIKGSIINFPNKTKEFLIFVDLFGATPFNVSGKAWNELKDEYNIRIVTGVNLPMILEVLPLINTHGVDELYKLALDSGREGIKELRDELYGN